MKPYVGITGFMTRAESTRALELFHELDLEQLGYSLMVGVLASSKTLKGMPNKWPGRYPDVNQIADIWPLGRDALRLVHYATDERETLRFQLQTLDELTLCNGFQLNITWPDPSELLEQVHKTIVLQVGRQAMAEHEFAPSRIADRLEAYVGCVAGVLFDASGGRGELVDEALIVPILNECRRRGLPFGWGVAGGLSAATLRYIDPFFEVCPSLSFDAEGRLRLADGDRLNEIAVEEYLKAAEAGILLSQVRARGAR